MIPSPLQVRTCGGLGKHDEQGNFEIDTVEFFINPCLIALLPLAYRLPCLPYLPKVGHNKLKRSVLKMKTTNDYSRVIAILFLVFAVALRFVPHPVNFAPIGALGLFAGCYLRGRGLWLIPVGAMVVSDWIGHLLNMPGFGLYSPVSLAFVYGGFALATLIGVALRGRVGPVSVVSAAFANALVFFVVSNFGVWLSELNGYAMNLTGLGECYYMAIPFFGNSVASDIFYSSLFFGLYQAIIAYLPSREVQTEEV